MKYQVIYESQSGNTELVARAIADCLPPAETELIDFSSTAVTSTDADIYCVGFCVHHSTAPMRLLEFLELLRGKTILLFATCGMNPTAAYHDVLERNMEPFLPDDCDYRGLYLCQGSISEDGFTALKQRFAVNDDEETMQRFEEFRIGAYHHPDENDLEDAQDFAELALDLW